MRSYRHLRLYRFVPRSLLHPASVYIGISMILGIGCLVLGYAEFLRNAEAFAGISYGDIVFYIGLAFSVYGLVLLLLFFADLETFRHIVRHVNASREAALGDDFNVAVEKRQSLSQAKSKNTEDMLKLIEGLVVELQNQHKTSEMKLAMIIAHIPYAILVVNTRALVSYANACAYALLGDEYVRVGTSVFAALSRSEYDTILVQARDSGGTCGGEIKTVFGVKHKVQMTILPEQCGAMLLFEQQHAADAGVGNDGYYDLSLLSSPRVVGELGADLPLSDTPFAVVDTETTGLNVLSDKVISFACVKMQGREVFPYLHADILINPQSPIPESSRKIHHISDRMVENQKNFADSWDSIVSHLHQHVVVGHNIAFDIAFLHRQARESGIIWRPQFYLDTCLLAGALNPDLRTLELDDIATYYHINVLGRHTALGDALVTTSLLRALLTEMGEHGIETLGEAVSLQMQMRDMLALQKRENWLTWQI